MIISGTGFFGNITVVTVTNSTTLEISASAGFTPSGTLTFTGNQGANAVAIGQSAGSTNQGTGAVAIGARAGLTNQGNNSIILNATGANLDQTTANTFTVAPVRNDVANTANVMFYNATSKEITYGNVINVAGNITGGNVNTGAVVSVGNLTFTAGANSWTFDTTGNLTVPNSIRLAPGTLITSFPLGSPAPSLSNFDSVQAANIVASNNFSTTTVSASGNITGSNLLTGGLISATGNITGGNILGLGGNITNFRSTNVTVENIFSINPGNVVNITAGGNNNLVVSNVLVQVQNVPLSVVGNITGGNLLTGGLISATGNITGGNLNVTGNIVDTGALSIITGSNGNIALAPNGTGIVTVSSNISITGNTATITSANLQIGYLEIPQISLAANVTANLTVSGKHYYSTSASNLALTLADNSAVSWPVGTAISVINRGTANVTVAPAAGVSLYLAGNATSGNRTVTTYGMATVMNVAANIWMINGTVV
jgi:hypothetical protein